MKYRNILFLAFLFLASTFAQLAMAVDEGAIVTCDQQKKILKIEHVLEPPNGFWKKYRSTGVNFSDLLVIKNDMVVRHKTKSFECHLNDTNISVTIEPQPFNDNIQGQCGAAVTGAITITKNNKTVLNREPFDTSSDCIVEGSIIIKSITVRSGDSVLQVQRIKKPDL